MQRIILRYSTGVLSEPVGRRGALSGSEVYDRFLCSVGKRGAENIFNGEGAFRIGKGIFCGTEKYFKPKEVVLHNADVTITVTF